MSKSNFLKSLKDSLSSSLEPPEEMGTDVPVAETVEAPVAVFDEPKVKYTDLAFGIVKDLTDNRYKVIKLKYNYAERKVDPNVYMDVSVMDRDEVNAHFKITVADSGILG